MLGFAELLVGGRGRVDHQAFGVADIRQMAEQIAAFDELDGGLMPAPYTEPN